MDQELTSLHDLIAELPRGSRPATVFLAKLLPNQKVPNLSSLRDFEAGDRADVLLRRGRRAIENVIFDASAVALMEDRGQTEKSIMLSLMHNMSLRMATHLNEMPGQLELVVVAARPASSKHIERQTEIYERNRSKYIAWAAETTLASGSDAGATVYLPGTSSTVRSANPQSAQTLKLDHTDLETMKERGTVPPEWSVEHIQARGLEVGACESDVNPCKNRIGNMIIMPSVVNNWTSVLECMQEQVVFPHGKNTACAEFMFCARPKHGPGEGFLLYGGNKPLGIPEDVLESLQEKEIPNMPKLDKLVRRAQTRISNCTI